MLALIKPLGVSLKCLLLAWLGLLWLMSPVNSLSAETRSARPDRLWQRAEAYMAGPQWIPGQMSVTEKVYNTKGELEEDEHIVIGFSAAGDHQIQMRLISAIKNGQDVYLKARAQVDRTTTRSELQEPSPFISTEEQDVVVRRNGMRRKIDGRSCIGFGFAFDTGEERLEGVAWLAQESGLPIEITTRVISVPFIAAGITVTAYTEVCHFSLTDTGECLLDRSREEIVFTAWGFKGRVDALHLFSHHWKLQPDG